MITVKVDTTEFNRKMQQYKKLTSKTVAEIVNTKAYYIALGALNATKHADKEAVKSELLSNSRNSKAPLAAILINKIRKSKGEKGLGGKEMLSAMKKFIAYRIRTINFVRAGWIPAIKGLYSLAKKDAGTVQIDKSVKSAGKPKGGAKAGKPSDIWSSVCTIWNSVAGSGGKESDYVNRIKMEGLQAAVDKETESITQYVNKKLQEAANKTINR